MSLRILPVFFSGVAAEYMLDIDLGPAPQPRSHWEMLTSSGASYPFTQRCVRAWLDIAQHLSLPNVTTASCDQQKTVNRILPDHKGLVCVLEPVVGGQYLYGSKWWHHGMGPKVGVVEKRGKMKIKTKRNAGPSWLQTKGAALIAAGDSSDWNKTLCGNYSNGLVPCLFATQSAMDFASRNVPPSTLLRPLRESAMRPKTRAVAFMFSNRGHLKVYRSAAYRWRFRDELAKVLPVERPIGNDDPVWGKSVLSRTVCQNNEAAELYRPYLFSVAFENNDSPGYISEKITNSFLGGTIPIYWGTTDVDKYFNHRAFIRAKDFNTLSDLAAYVKRVHDNRTLREEYLSQPPCTEEGLRRLMWWRRGPRWADLSGPLETLNCSSQLPRNQRPLARFT